MSKTDPINTSVPPDIGESPALGASRIRTFARGVIELFGIDHYTGPTSPYNSEVAGEHTRVTIQNRTVKPDNYGDGRHILYAKDVDGASEIFDVGESGVEKQLTNKGKLNVSATEAVLLTGDQEIGGRKTFEEAPLIPGALSIRRDENALTTVWSSNGKSMTGVGSHWKTAGVSLVEPGDYVRVLSGTNATPGDYLVSAVGSDASITLATSIGTDPASVNYILLQATSSEFVPVVGQDYVDDQISASMDPANYTGQESVTYKNGLIEKTGLSSTVTHSSYLDVTFAVPFPTAAVFACVTPKYSTAVAGNMVMYVTNLTTTGFRIVLDNSPGSTDAPAYWFARGH